MEPFKRIKAGHVLFGFGLVAIAATLSACGLLYSSHNYRVTVDVDVDGKTYTGSSVQRYKTRAAIKGAFGDTPQAEVFGEAVVVDLKSRGKLFVIMRDGETDPATGGPILGSADKMLYKVELIDGQFQSISDVGAWEVPQNRMPAMVTFTNLADPKSIVQVDPAHLEKTFGPGVRLDKVTFELTGKPVTTGKVEQYLPWLKGKLEQRHLNGMWGEGGDPSPAANVNNIDFKHEEEK